MHNSKQMCIWYACAERNNKLISIYSEYIIETK